MAEKQTARRNTRTRREILNILKEAQQPLSAAEIYEKLILNNEKPSLSTVYRALESFAESGEVIKGTLMDIAHYYIRGSGHTHFAVCTECKGAVPLKSCPMESIQLEDDGFQVRGHSLELFGICKNCREKGLQINSG